MDLLLTLPDGIGKQAAVEGALRTAIVDGRLPPGAALPSTRTLAIELGVARGTVVTAIEHLVFEGLLETRRGAATRVAHVPSPARRLTADPRSPAAPTADFAGGEPDLSLFPHAAWSGAVRRALTQADLGTFGYGDHRGSITLRRALADYVARTRGVIADPERMIVTAGFAQALAIIGRAVAATRPPRIHVEDPSLLRQHETLRHAGLACLPVRVDRDGIRVGDLAASPGGTVMVTPAHHTPLGVSLSPARRTELAGWADECDGLIVEDDYDGELRFDRRPLRALHGLAPERVVYCGTASKSLAPALRLGWCVVPADLVTPMVDALVSIGGTAVSIVEQLAMAELLASGTYDRQVRRIRNEYRHRREQLVAALAEHVPVARVEGAPAGIKALIRLPDGADERDIVDRLAARSCAVFALRDFAMDGRVAAEGPAIVVNYARPFSHQFRAALARLVESLGAVL